MEGSFEMDDVIGIYMFVQQLYYCQQCFNLVQTRAAKPSKQVNLINLELKLDNKDSDASKLQLLSVLTQNPTFLGRVG